MLNAFSGTSRLHKLSILALILIQPFVVHGDEIGSEPTVPKLFGEPSSLNPGAAYILALSPQDIQAQLFNHTKQKQAKSDAGQDLLLRSDDQSDLLSFPGTTFQGGHSGLWVNQLEVGGHGVFIEIIADSAVASGMKALVGWYVYSAGVPIWYVGVGNVVVEGSRQKAYIDASRYTGGSFPPNFNVNTVSQAGSGTMWLEFNGCDFGTMGWNLTDGTGSMSIQRLTKIKDTNCDPELGGSGGTSDDHGNTYLTASNISGSRTGNIETPNDVDVFITGILGCTGPCPQSFRVKAWTTGNLDTVGALYGIVGGAEQFLGGDDDSGDGNNFLIDMMFNWAATSHRQHTIHVSSFGSATGSYTLWVERTTSSGGGAQIIRVEFENRLLVSIEAFQNGVSLGYVEPVETRGSNLSVTVGDQFSFKAVQTYGDHMEGIYPALTDTTLDKEYVANNIIGSQHFFYPRITNNTSKGRLIGVNVGLQSENLCSCVAPANTSNVGQMYYRLFSNSNFRLYDSTSTYNAAYVFWENFANNAQAETGRIDFTLNP